jgi:hypothetical protein
MSKIPRSKSPRPTFNHVAMSVPSELLDEGGRGDLLRFFNEVFGFTEMPTMTKDGELLVLRAHSNEQFVYLHAADDPMRCPPADHFGMSVASEAELDGMLERARKLQEIDSGVEIIEKQSDDFKVLKLHSFYVRYRLPLMIEVQCFDWAEGVGADSLPDA